MSEKEPADTPQEPTSKPFGEAPPPRQRTDSIEDQDTGTGETGDVLDLFTDNDPTRRIKGARAPVIIVFGGKGGVGVSTVATILAETAAVVGGMKGVVLVDANPTRGDQSLFLRTSASTPNIFTGHTMGDWRQGSISPERINGHRPGNVPDVGFGTVLAPAPGQVTDTAGLARSYAQTVSKLRDSTKVDLVVVDAGTIDLGESHDIRDLFLLPLLRGGCWSVGVTNSTQAGLIHLREVLTHYEEIPRDRTMTLLNACRTSFMERGSHELALKMFDRFSITLGALGYDEENIGNVIEIGHVPHDHPELAPMLANVLLRVTGRDAFTALAEGTVPEPRKTRGLPVRRLGRKKARA